MADSPLLTSVSLALPTKLQGASHIAQCINHLLLPPTIDAAVYLDLQRVVKVFGDTSPWTVGAMDGAAARGDLNLVKWLDTNRTEGCSTAALNGAVASNHLDVVYWLLERYPGQCNVAEGLRKAAEAGQMDTVVMLLPKCDPYNVGEPLGIAIANGHLAIAEFLLPNCQPFDMGSALAAAADKDMPEMLERIVSQCGYDVGFRGQIAFRSSLISAASRGSAQIVKLLTNAIPVPMSGLPFQTIGSVIYDAAASSKYEIVEVVLDVLHAKGSKLIRHVARALKNEHTRNDTKMVKILTKYCGEHVLTQVC
ncbi:hypothetical protein DVH05_009765 [Phytophthora capsici]|nr:hypothetical protein DVH05_009765 [Phytophthora capsici]